MKAHYARVLRLLCSFPLSMIACGDGGFASEPEEASPPPELEAAAPGVSTPARPGSAPSTALATCQGKRLRTGDVRGSLRHGGRTRTYLLHVPASFKGGPVALVLDFHGYSRTGSSQRSGSGWDKLSEREGILVAYPDGVGSSWNVGGCCGSAGSANVDDVGFVRALIDKLASEACVDRTRVFASGVSNGAGMVGRLGCEAADVIAGVSLVSSDLRTSPCRPVRPVTEIAFRGTADTLEPYEGGLVGPTGGKYQSPGARGSFELYRKLNQCTGEPAASTKYCETYATCAEGTEVTLCTLPGVGHSPYSNRLGVDIAQTSWEAFARAPRRSTASGSVTRN